MLPGMGSITLATRKIPGGRERVLEYVRLAALDDDAHCKAFLVVWDDLKAYEQAAVTLDDVCTAAGISPVRLVKAMVGTAFETGVDIGNFVAALSHPDVVESAVKWAKKKDGVEDRKLLFQHHGFVPTPRGTTINVGVNASANASALAAANAGSDSSVPGFLEDIDAVADGREDVQKLLIAAPIEDPAISAILQPVDAELVK